MKTHFVYLRNSRSYPGLLKKFALAFLSLTFSISIGVISAHAATVSGSQTMTLDGRLLDSSGVNALLDPSVVIDIKIYNPSASCILYEEHQTIDSTQTEGRFTILIGSAVGSSKRVAGIDPGNPMVTVFSNQVVIAGSSCTYTPSAGDTRLMRLTVSPSTTGTVEQLTPDTLVDSVPFALMAESLQGLDRDHVLAIDSTTFLSQSNVANIFSSSNYPILTALIAGTGNQYLSSSPSGGAKIPAVATQPTSPVAGQIWFNASGGAFQYYNGSSVQTIGAAGAGISSLTVGSNLSVSGTPGGTLSGPGTIDIIDSGVASGSYSKVSVNSKGLVTFGTGLSESDIPTLVSPGHVSGNAITSGTIGGTTNFYSSGNVSVPTVSSGQSITRQIQLFDPASGSTHKITILAPTLSSDYSLVFPATAGTAGYALTTDGSGNLSWTSTSSGSVTSVGLNLPSIFSVTQPIVTSSGTLTATLSNQNANLIFAGPGSGLASVPTFRNLTVADLPAGYDTSVMKTNLNAGQIWIGNASNLASTVTPTGDITLSMTGSGTVTGLQGYAISPTAPAYSGQVLRWNGTAWTPNSIAMSDLRSTITGSSQLSSCASNQTLVFNSVTDSLLCSSIQISDSQVAFGNKTSGTILAGPSTGSSGQPAFRSLASTDLPISGVTAGTYKLVMTDIYGRITAGTNPTTLNGFGITDAVQNLGGSPALQSGIDSAKPASPVTGTIYFATDTKTIYEYSSGSWLQLASNAGSGGTLNSLTGDVTTTGSGNVTASVMLVGGSSANAVHTAEILANNATSLNTPNQIIKRDVSGNFVATTATLTSANVGSIVYKGGSNTVTVSAPATLSSSYSVVWPQAQGSALQVMQTDGSGNLSWITPSSVATSYSGILPVGNGGTGTSTPPNQYGIIFASTSSGYASTAQGSTGLPLVAQGASAPVFSALSLSGSGVSGVLPVSAGGTNTATANTSYVFAGPTTGSAGPPSFRPLAATDFPTGTATQWLNNGSSIYYSSGAIGIGSSNPGALLDIASSSTSGTISRLTNTDVGGRIWAIISSASGNSGGAGQFGVHDTTANVRRLTIDTLGNVGIGTSSPQAFLDVLGTGSQSAMIVPRDSTLNRPSSSVNGMIRYNTSLNQLEAYSSGAWSGMATNSNVSGNYLPLTGGILSGAITYPAGMSSAPSINFGDPTSGLYATGSGNLSFATSNNSRLSILSNGNIGIGTSTPSSILETYGDGNFISARASSTSGFTQIGAIAKDYYSAPSYTGTYLLQFGSGASGTNSGLNNASLGILNFQNGSAGLIQTNGLTPIVIGTYSHERIRVNSYGSVGIGTSFPQSLLDIYGTGASSALIVPRDSSANRPPGVNGMIRYNTDLAKLETYSSGAWNSVATSGTNGGASPWTQSGSNIYYNSTGNVGVGITSPANALDINGGVAIGSYAGTPTQSGYLIVPNRIGIGTSAPSFALDVSGNTRITGSLWETSGSQTSPSHSFATDASTGMYLAGSGTLSFATGSTSRLTINSSGNIGIGTLTPQAFLDITGFGGNSAILVPRDSTGNRPSGTNGMLRYNTDLAKLEIYSSGAWNSVATSAVNGGASPWTQSGSNIFYGSGNVGIGTSAPLNLLALQGSSNYGVMEIVGSGVGSEASVGFRSSNVSKGAAGDWVVGANIGSVGSFGFYSPSVGTILSISSSGNGSVGVGLSAPVVPLQARGFTSSPSLTANNELFRLDSTSGNTQALAIGLDSTNGYEAWIQTKRSSNDGTSFPLTLNALGGNVGVGTTSPQALLDIYSSGLSSAILVPRATIAQRPTAAINGMIRYQIDNQQLEAYTNGIWSTIATGSSGASQWTTSGSNIYYNVSSGNVGIGTNSPNTPLQIVTTDTSGLQLQLTSTNNASGRAGISINNSNAGAGFQIQQLANGSAILQNYGSGNITAFLGGNVGVGTSAPVGKLQVFQSIDSSTTGLTVTNSGGTRSTFVWTDGSNNARVDSGAAGTSPLILNGGGGNVGIGTTSPISALHLYSPGVSGTVVQIQNSDTGGHQWTVNSSGSGNSMGAGKFVIGDSTAGLNRFLIDTTGNVGIGTTSPNATLAVAGHISNVGAASTVTSCGTSPAITGNDTRGVITLGTGGPTACTVTFAAAYSTSPYCVVSARGGDPGSVRWWLAESTTALTVTFSATPTTSQQFEYHCMQ